MNPLEHNSGPVAGLIKICERWGIEEGGLATLLGYERGESIPCIQKVNGRMCLKGRDAEQRFFYYFEIHKALFALFKNNETTEREWIREPQPEEFGGKTPLELMTNGTLVDVEKVFKLVMYMSGY